MIATSKDGKDERIEASAVILACGGIESSTELRQKYIGDAWKAAKVRGTPHNTGDGLIEAFTLGAREYGFYQGCHAGLEGNQKLGGLV